MIYLSLVLDIYSWNVFLLVCSIAPLSAGILLWFSPESPKFLMSTGKNDEALKVFKRVYRLNTGKSEDTFLVTMHIISKLDNHSSPIDCLCRPFCNIRV